jgi:hypothetical protein
MSSAVNTGHVTGRRRLRFSSPADILAEAERIAGSREVRTLGNWTPGQIFRHLAVVMNKSIDSFDNKGPLLVRLFLRVFVGKRKVLAGPMPAGFRLPEKGAAELVPSATDVHEGLQDLRGAVRRLQAETKRAPNPFLGPLTVEEWNQLHCRHAEMHLSFLVPVE